MSPKTAFVFCLLVMTICILHVEAAPTCAEPTCGGTRQAAPGEGGEGGEEEEEKPGCAKPGAWRNYYAVGKWCDEGIVGATENPPGKIGSPPADDAAGGGAGGAMMMGGAGGDKK